MWVRLRVLHGKPVCISVSEMTRAGHRDSAKRKTSSFPRPVLGSGVSLSAGTRGGCGSEIDYGRRSLSDGLACTGLSREVSYCISLGRIMIRSKCRDRDSSGRNTSPLAGSPAANPPACDASAPLNSRMQCPSPAVEIWCDNKRCPWRTLIHTAWLCGRCACTFFAPRSYPSRSTSTNAVL